MSKNAIPFLEAEARELIDEAKSITQRVAAEGREIRPDEEREVGAKLAQAKSLTNRIVEIRDSASVMRAVANASVGAKGPTVGPSLATGLLARFKRAGWNPSEGTNRAEIPFAEFYVGAKGATVEAGDLNAFGRTERDGAPLGYDSRRLYPNLPLDPVASDVTAVEVFRQSSRTLASPADMQRDIDETTPKPETATAVEIEIASLKQIASVSSGIPNILLERASFATLVQQDLRLAFEDAVDDLCIDALNAAGPTQQPAGSDIFREVREAITTLQAAGYGPSLVAMSPEVAEDLDLFQEGDGVLDSPRYAFALSARDTDPQPLFGLKIAVVKNLENVFVIDASAIGRLYLSGVRIARFEENDGKSNSSLIRLEANGLFGAERPTAAVEILTGS